MLLRLGEDIRLEAVIFDQALLSHARPSGSTGSARRYLETIKRAILNDHHIENEARIHHLLTRRASGGPPNEADAPGPGRATRRH